ncbi:hypothetical protein [Halpernia sp. GG3]
MKFKKLLQYFVFLSIILTILVFISLYKRENGNMKVVFFGTFLYLPYVFIFSGLNFFLIQFGMKGLTKRPLIFLPAIFLNIFLTTWFLLSGGQVEVRFWKLTLTEFVILNIAILLVNILIINSLKSENRNIEKDEKEIKHSL